MEHCEFDPKKSSRNRELHGVDLSWAQALWDETHVIIPARNVSGESRSLILAKSNGRLYAAIFTKRGEAIRLISCHKADRRLEKIYENCIQSRKN